MDLQNASAEQILAEIQQGGSLLGALGQQKLVQKLSKLKLLVGLAMVVLTGIRYVDYDRRPRVRHRIARLLKFFTPYRLRTVPAVEQHEGAIFMGFNHPSLGEIPRLISYVLANFPRRTLYFPVNLKYYEAFASHIQRLRDIGIELVPLITPSLAAELTASTTDPQTQAQIRSLASRLQQNYLNQALFCVLHHGILLVAPSATRQATVFRSRDEYLGHDKLQPTMTLLVLSVRNCNSAQDLLIVPVSVNPGTMRDGVNLFVRYQLATNCTYKFGECMALSRGRERAFEYFFLKNLTKDLPKYMHYPSSKD